jgi:hypothetical protein
LPTKVIVVLPMVELRSVAFGVADERSDHRLA